ncbi:MAG: hypothetical protein QOG19_2134, partial [Mycobacterium sp.]|nr:hypothetical protein [Mycobacterium sp.]
MRGPLHRFALESLEDSADGGDRDRGEHV